MRCSRRKWSDSGLARGVALAALIAGLGARVVAAQPPVPGALQGDVVDSAGTPLRGAIVRLPATGARMHTDGAGRFSFERVPPGRHEIVGLLIGYLAAQDSVVVRSGETTHVRFKLTMPPLRIDTLPPRLARGTHADTAPSQPETIDRVARVARLPRLRPQPADRAQRELRIWVGGGLGIPMRLLRITDDGTRVRGEEILWLVQTIPDRDVSPRWRAFVDSVPGWLRHDFHCGPAATDTIHHPGAQPGYRNTLVAACRVQFAREPDWRAVLAELERHHVFTLPDGSELPVVVKRRRVNEEVYTLDGVGVTVEAWNGTRYRAYTIGNPDQQPFPEYHDASAILRLVVTFPTTHSPDQRQ
jgi:hypothetical protein